MQLALELAIQGKGSVSPNPLVGCVIVKDDIIIGQGYHMKYGEPHAEPNAVNSVMNKEEIKGSDVYVTLEPCAHYGKTPPCANLLAGLHPKRVIIGAIDSNPLVENKGVKILEEAGIQVDIGILNSESIKMNRRFFTRIEKNRPYIILKWAQSKDGFIGGDNFEQVAISNSESQKVSHQLRADEDAILVGKNTALHDNPNLTTRHKIGGKNPLRIYLDKNLEVPSSHNLLNGVTPTICYNSKRNESLENLEFVQVDFNDSIHQILKDLQDRKIGSLIVEGGAQLLQSFIDKDLWDEALVFTGDKNINSGTKAPNFDMASDTEEFINNDVLNRYSNSNPSTLK